MFFGEKPMHVHVMMGLKKAQKQDRDYTTQKKTNLVREEYPIRLLLTLNGVMEQM